MKNDKNKNTSFKIVSNQSSQMLLQKYGIASEIVTNQVLSAYKIITLSEITTPYGILVALADDRFVYFLRFKESVPFTSSLKKIIESFKTSLYCTEKESATIQKLKQELKLYFEGRLQIFTVPYKIGGTPYQQKVWQALTTVVYATTVTYKEIAHLTYNPKAVRAVGNANNKNPIALIIPCHRVVGSNGKLVGYAGGVGVKQKLIFLEKTSL